MNEVRLSPAVNTVTGTASSAGSGEKRKAAEVDSPAVEVANNASKLQSEKAATDEVVMEAVSELNSYVQNEQRELLFNVDEGSGDMVVRVVDRESGELIRQIPNDVVLDLAAKAKANEPLQLINMHG